MNIHANAVLVLIDMQTGINHPKLGRRNNQQAEEQMLSLLGVLEVHAMSLGNLHGEYARVLPATEILALTT